MKRILAWAVLLAMMSAVNASAQKVTSVSDADTIVVAGIGKVRLAGIARADQQVRLGPTGPPPTRPPSNPAMPPPLISAGVNLSPDRSGQKALRELVLGKDVKLEFDQRSDDKDNRKAYVFLPDGTLVNAEMLRQGRARVDTSSPFARMDEFKEIEAEARGASRGIWAEVRR